MAEKWKARKYTLHGKSRYDIATEELDIATVYEDAYLPLIIAVPLMLETLNAAYSEIFQLVTTSRMIQACHTEKSGDVLTTIAAAIAAAKGE